MADPPDDGLNWLRQLYGGYAGSGGPPSTGGAMPGGGAGVMPGGGDSYPAYSGQGPYIGYPATQNPFPGQPAAAHPTSWWRNLMSGLNPISSAQAETLPESQSASGTTTTTSPTQSSEDLLNNILKQHANETPNLDKAIEATPRPGAYGAPATTTPGTTLNSNPVARPVTPQPPPGQSVAPYNPGLQGTVEGAPSPTGTSVTAAPSGGWGSALRTGLEAVLPASTLLQGLASGNKGIRDIQQRAAAERDAAAYPDSTTYPQTQPQPQRAPLPPTPSVTTLFGDPPLPPVRPPPPVVQAPIPVGQPHLGGHPAHAGAARQQPVGALGDTSVTGAAPPSPGEYFATTGNARGASWTPGGFASPPAQHFQTPLTPMFGPGQWIGGPAQAAAPAGRAAPQTVGQGAPGGYNVAGLFANLPNNTFNNSGAAPAPSRAARARRPLMDTGGFAPGPGYIGGL